MWICELLDPHHNCCQPNQTRNTIASIVSSLIWMDNKRNIKYDILYFLIVNATWLYSSIEMFCSLMG